jgi:DNA-binding transcriptional LysR family regulator
MRDLNDLNFFAAVVANGGFSAAARALGAPKSRVSRRVAALEAQLGVRLVERSTRRFKVTEVGQDVYRHARAALCEAEAIDEVVTRLKAEPQGLVRVSVPMGLDRLIGLSMPRFLVQHPKLRVQMIVANRRFDLINEGIDVAVRVRETLDTDADLQLKVVSRTGLILVASPTFLAQYGTPSRPEELAAYPTVDLTEQPGPGLWVLENTAGESVEVVFEPRLSSSSFTILRQAVVDDVGVAVLPEWAAREGIAEGKLVQILPDWTRRQGILHMVFTSRRGQLPGVRAMIDFLAEVLDPKSPAWEYAV